MRMMTRLTRRVEPCANCCTLAAIRKPEPRAIEETVGSKEARGANRGIIADSLDTTSRIRDKCRDHFRNAHQKLTIRHDSGSSARPYVDGALLASVRPYADRVHRGLDTVLDI